MPIHEGLNTELLLKVKDHILEEPKRLLMNYFVAVNNKVTTHGTIEKGNKFRAYSIGYGEPPVIQLPECNTVACIAGWTCLIGDPRDKDYFYDFSLHATDLLKTYDTSLFYVSKWPSKLGNAYYKAKTRKQRAIIVGKVIDAYIRGDF